MTRRRARLVGIGETAYVRHGRSGASPLALACTAIERAAADAGMELADVDGLASFGYDRTHPGLLAQHLRLRRLRWASLAWAPGGEAACGAVAHAAAAVESGQAEVVAVVRSISHDGGERFGGHRDDRPLGAFDAPFGLFVPAPMVAMVIRRHMHLHGTTTDQLGAVAVSTRAHANRNPRAVMHTRSMTMADHRSARPIADPLRLLDCCLETDGAAAVLVTTAERAGGVRHRPVEVLGAAHGTERWVGTGAMGGHNVPTDRYATAYAEGVAREVYAKAGIRPDDVDCAQVYDAFTAMVLLALEAYGFCDPGDAGPFAAAGSLAWPDGTLPTNTAGGHLSEAYVQGMNHVVEAVRQLRGTSTAQVPDARVVLVTGAVLAAPTSALVLAA